MTQLERLIARTPESMVESVDKGFGDVDYIPHYHIAQLLLYITGPFNWSVSEPFDSGDAKEPVAVIGTLLVTIDDKEVMVEGIGSDRDAKKAESDAMKRCAMKIGLGLELWAQKGYWLDTQYKKDKEKT